jgi:hypothetical protein
MERAKNKSKSFKERRTKWCEGFCIDSLAILGANDIKLKQVKKKDHSPVLV